jgi:hypothetical protein
MKHGLGSLVKDGIIYEGEWSKNRKNGNGWEINLKGNTKRKGEWKNGELARWLSKTETVSGSIKTTEMF